MDITLTLPKSWHDLREGQLEKVAGYFLKYQDKQELLTHCFLLFSGWKIIRWRMMLSTDWNYFFFKSKGKPMFRIKTDVFVALVNNLQWLMEGYRIPAYVPAIKGFSTPNLMMYSTTTEQFLAAENYYNRFIETGDFNHLNYCLACIYSNDFTTVDIQTAAKVISKKNLHSRFAAFIWYCGVKAWLKQKYPYVFSGNNDQGDHAPDTTILNLLSSLNEGDITRNERIMKTRMHEAFHELNQKIEYSTTKSHV